MIRLIVKMMRKRNVIALTFFKQFVKNLVSQHSRALLERVSVLLAKRRCVHRVCKKPNSVLFAKLFDKKAVLDALFAAYAVLNVDCNDVFVELQHRMKKCNGISSAAQSNTDDGILWNIRSFKK